MDNGIPSPQIDTPKQAKKACQITIMFPVDSDSDAINIKHKINAIVDDIEGKRYTFNIVEM